MKMSNMFGSGFVYGINLQNSVSPVSRETMLFHDEKLAVLMVMACLVGGSMTLLWLKNFKSYDFIESKGIEVGWTMMPVVVLLVLGLPSLELLFYVDSPSSVAPYATLKAIGRQWYWSYEMSSMGQNDQNLFNYDSYMLPLDQEKETEGDKAGFRLLEVDKPIFMPRASYIRLLVTGGDVMHSFCVPSLGVKMDAVPGRLNQTFFYPLKLGSFYGQCSEMCGANHSFMPINMEVVPQTVFSKFFK